MSAPLPSHHLAANLAPGARFRTAGDLTLDLVHCDARVDDCWLGLEREAFAVLWQLTAVPGERLTPDELSAETRQNGDDREPDSAARGLAGLKARLAAVGMAYLICTDGERRVFLDAQPFVGAARAWMRG